MQNFVDCDTDGFMAAAIRAELLTAHWAEGTEVEPLARHMAVADGFDPEAKVSVYVPQQMARRQAWIVPSLERQQPVWQVYAEDAAVAIEWIKARG